MVVAMDCLFLLIVVGFSVCGFALVRNQMVLRFRMFIHDLVFINNIYQSNILVQKTPNYEEYKKQVKLLTSEGIITSSYDRMMWSFRLKSHVRIPDGFIGWDKPLSEEERGILLGRKESVIYHHIEKSLADVDAFGKKHVWKKRSGDDV